MKNNASHLAEKQALSTQAYQLLPEITQALSALEYSDIVHQRLSQNNAHTIIYQGLTRAKQDQFGQVMIKWQLSANNDTDSTLLNHEIAVLKLLSSLQDKNKPITSIVPSLFTSKTISLNISEQHQLLTIMVMPWYRQGSVAQYIKQLLTIEQKHQLLVRIAQLIDSLHQSGWLHNDIKPSNILIHDDYSHNIHAKNISLLLTDFALAEPVESNNQDNVNVEYNTGTPAYLAPERWQGQGASMQSEVYAFGVMMYEILTGERPFKIDNQRCEPLRGWAIQHCQRFIPLLPTQYHCYQALLDKALAKHVEKRYLRMDEVLKDLIQL